MSDEMKENQNANTVDLLPPNQAPEIRLVESVEPTWPLVWKTVVTGGYYLYGTLLNWRYIAPDLMQSAKVTKTMIFILACLWGGTDLLHTGVDLFTEEIVDQRTDAPLLVTRGVGVLCSNMISLITVFGEVFVIVMAFKLKPAVIAIARLRDRENFRVNGFYLFLFNLLYINYLFNSLKKK